MADTGAALLIKLANVRSTLSALIEKAKGGGHSLQARVPAGSSKGGQFASGGGAGGWGGLASMLGVHAPQLGLFNQKILEQQQLAQFLPKMGTQAVGGGGKNDSVMWSNDHPASGELHGVKFEPWKAPTTDEGWAKVEGQAKIKEPPVPDLPAGKHLGSGVIIKEPDGRVWVVEPANHFGGYAHTFPKGTAEPGLSLQANAIKEAFEESGLKVKITGHLGDVERDTSVARYYSAVRVGGSPSAAGWESQAVKLVPAAKLKGMLNKPVDRALVDAHVLAVKKAEDEAMEELSARLLALRLDVLKGYNPNQPRVHGGPKGGQWTATGGGMATPGGAGGAAPLVLTLATGKNAENSALIAANKAITSYQHMANAGDIHALIAAKPFVSANPNPYQKAKGTEWQKAMEHAQANAAKADVPEVTKLTPAGEAHAKPILDAHAAAQKPVFSNETGHMQFDPATFKQTGPQLGSNPGGRFMAPNGKEYYVKFSKSDDHAKNEYTAARLLKASGEPTLQTHMVDLPGGKLGTATLWEKNEGNIDLNNASHIAEAQKSFAVHAWLSNYDAIGTGHGTDLNMAMVNGKLTNMDVGGALIFRAQGAPKGVAFGSKVTELETMRDHTYSPNGAKVYGKMTGEQLVKSIEQVKHIDDAVIREIVLKHGPGTPADRHILAEKMVNRKYDLVATGEKMNEKLGNDAPAAIKTASDSAVMAKAAGIEHGIAPGELGFLKAEVMAFHYANGDIASLKSAVEGSVVIKAQGYGKKLLADLEAKQAHANAPLVSAIKNPPELSGKAGAGPMSKIQKFAESGNADGLEKYLGNVKSADWFESNANYKTVHGWGESVLAEMKSGTTPKPAAPVLPKVPETNSVTASQQMGHIDSILKSNPKQEAINALEGIVADKYGWHPETQAYAAKALETLTAKDQSSVSVAAAAAKLADQPMTYVNAHATKTLTSAEMPEKPIVTSKSNLHENKKYDAIEKMALEGNVEGILKQGYGTNTYGKGQAKYANEILAKMGVQNHVFPGKKAGQLGAAGHQAEHTAVTVKITTTPSSGAPKVLPKLDTSLLQSPPNYHTFKNGGPVSSKPEVNDKNNAKVQDMFILAQEGNLAKLKQYDTTILTPEGNIKNITNVEAYKIALIDEIESQLYPAKAGASFVYRDVPEVLGAKTLSQSLQASASYFKPITNTDIVALDSTKKLDKYVILGHIGDVKPARQFWETNNATMPSAVKSAQNSYVAKNGTTTEKESFTYYTQSGYGGMNQQLMAGGGANPAVKAISKLLMNAPEVPEGTKLVRKLSPNQGAMTKLHTKVKIGTIIQSPTVDSTSVDGVAWSGHLHLHIRTTAGVKGVWAGEGSIGKNKGENEVVLHPNTRYVITGIKPQTNPTIHNPTIIEVVALPHDGTL